MSKKVKIILAIVLVLFLGVGGTLGAAFMGFLKIPGLKIGPQKATVKKDDKKKDDKKPVAKVTPPTKKKEPPPTPIPQPDPDKGYQKLATVWEAMEPSALKEATKKWKAPELARVLIFMDEDKVAVVLAQLEPSRAGEVMQVMETIASKPVITTKPATGSI